MKAYSNATVAIEKEKATGKTTTRLNAQEKEAAKTKMMTGLLTNAGVTDKQAQAKAAAFVQKLSDSRQK